MHGVTMKFTFFSVSNDDLTSVKFPTVVPTSTHIHGKIDICAINNML